MLLEPLGRRKIVSPKNKTSKIIIETGFFFWEGEKLSVQKIKLQK